MKIAQISTFSPFLLGGQEAVVYNLSKELGKNGHEVTVIASNINTKVKADFTDFNTVHIPSFRFNNRLIIPRNLDAIRSYIAKAEIVHVHSPDVSFAFELGLLAKTMRKPIVTSVLSYFDSFKHPFLPMKFLAFPIEMSLSVLAKISEAVHVKNIGDYAKLSRLCGDVAYIPDGIPDSFFELPKNPSLFNKKFGIKDETIILYVGRLHPLKGPQILVRSLKYLVNKESKILLVIAGPGMDYRRHLENLSKKLGLEKHVIFTGILSEEEKISAYDAANVVVVPSCNDLVEAFSLVASEAWARGKPVVASDIGALRYRVVPEKNGCLAEPNDPRDLAEKILKALELKVTKIPDDVCSWKVVAKNFEQLYENVIASKRNPFKL